MRNRNEIGAIETVFDGYRFRSRLEARWAVFFKTAGIRYIYEPECFRLPSGKLYLPDFYLPEVNMRTTEDEGGIYVEVKPSKPNSAEIDYLFELSKITGKGVLLLEGMPALWNGFFDAEGDGHYDCSWDPQFGNTAWDVCMLFARCYECYRVRVQHGYYQEPYEYGQYCEYCLNQLGEKSPCNAAHPSLVHAVKVARSYRFDNHGRGLRLTAGCGCWQVEELSDEVAVGFGVDDACGDEFGDGAGDVDAG